MNRILPFLPVPTPITGKVAARQFDAGVLDADPLLDAFCRPMIEFELAAAPDSLRAALAQPLMKPFRYVVLVARVFGDGLFSHRKEVRQVRTSEGFDSSIAGTLRGGFLSNGPDRPAGPPKSKGELSHLLYSPPR